ncbi:acyltransferase domain-containing protein [Streptomyces sp. LX-29]|nr:acyltransferase domain-containing protein [Streptomyces sp. LX-29]
MSATGQELTAVGGGIDSRFWQAIEEQDLPTLTQTLQLHNTEHHTSLNTLLPTLAQWHRQQRDHTIINTWRYTTTWKPAPPPPTPLTTNHHILLITPTNPTTTEPITTWTNTLNHHNIPHHTITINPTTTNTQTLTQQLTHTTPTPTHILSFLALDENPHPTHTATPNGTHTTLTLIQTLNTTHPNTPLWCITQSATTTGPHDPLNNPTQALIWGLGHTTALEHPHNWGGLIDHPTTPNYPHHHITTTLQHITTPTNHPHKQNQLAIRPNGLHTPRLQHATPPPTHTTPPWNPHGTTLITGGTGALATHIAHHIATHHTAPHLLLASRRGPNAPGATQLHAKLTELGAHVTITACDTANPQDLTQLLNTIPPQHPLTTVIHTAATLNDATLTNLTPHQLNTTLHAKKQTAHNLHHLTQNHPITTFILFSSAAATLGSPGQAHYAAANAYLDALAHHRHTHNLPATSIAWGPWAHTGMAANPTTQQHLQRHGLTPLPPHLATTALTHTPPNTITTIANINWNQLTPTLTTTHPNPLITDIPETHQHNPHTNPPTPHTNQPTTPTTLHQQLTTLPPTKRHPTLLNLIQTHAATTLGHPNSQAVRGDRAFSQLGFDSLTAMQLRNRLAAATGLQLPTSLVFDYPTPTALADYLCAELLDTHSSPASPLAVTFSSPDEPIAVVGMACRYPGGVSSPEALWDLVAAGGDAVSGFPTDRGWDLLKLYSADPDQPGKSYVREGGFLHDAAEFDPAFFGLSPREALAMDPQQRLLLETSWEAVERAGIDPTSLHGKQIGVFVGAAAQEYAPRLHEAADGVEGYVVTGNATSVMSGRLSYTFGLEGPAVTIDTACSSSLVALHLACQALRSGECSLALAGGVTVMSSPFSFVEFSRQRALAEDGRCKAFAESADGTGWAEGAGMLLLEPLSQARRNGHPVLAVVRGSAVNQDGASNGLTAPNGPSQQRVIRQALANADLRAADVDAVEAHGTGTTLGDPIEAQAVLATYGSDRSADRPLWLGSLKSNIGHTQAAAGVAGVIKMVMAMRHELLPKTLHVDAPTSHVDWSAGAVSLLTKARPWPRTDRLRRAGVSSFGVSGTNAHLILEEPSQVEEPAGGTPSDMGNEGRERVLESGVVPWLISGRGEAAVRDLAVRLRHHLQDRPDLDPVDVGWSLATTRTSFENRTVILGRDRDELLNGLHTLTTPDPAPHVITGNTTTPTGKTVFVFPGQGSQWAGMAADLLDSSVVFREHIEACEEALAPYVDWSLGEVLRQADGAASLERVDVIQPVLFAVMVGLARMWQACGIHPDAVIGHSQGEIAAAHIAGALTLHDAAAVVALRSRALARLAGHGAMASVSLSVDEAEERLAAWQGRLAIAAINGPRTVIVSGESEAVEELLAECAKQDIRARRIPVDYASHGPQVEAVEDEIRNSLASITPAAPSIPLLSTVTGQWITGPDMDAGYWYHNLRQPVRLADALHTLAADGHHTFIETSPHPVLTHTIHDTLDPTDSDPATNDTIEPLVIGTLRRDEDGPRRFLTSLAQAHTHGLPITWEHLYTGTQAQRVDLPTYPFQRERYWLASAAASTPLGWMGSGMVWRPGSGRRSNART